MGKGLVEEYSLGLVVRSMKGNSRMDIDMVKEYTPGLMETSM